MSKLPLVIILDILEICLNCLRGRGSRFFAIGQPQMRPEAHCASTRRPVRRAEEIWLRRQAR